MFYLDKRSFAYYNTEISDWYAESGRYTIYIGTSSRDLPVKCSVELVAKPLPLKLDDTLTVGDILEFTDDREVLEKLSPMVSRFTGDFSGLDGKEHRQMFSHMLDGLPLHSVKSFSNTTDEDIEAVYELLRRLNEQ